MASQLFQVGLTLSDYIQNAILEEPQKPVTYQTGFEQTPHPVVDQPPGIIKGIIESCRPYFKLTYVDAINNLKYLLLPIGKGRHLLKDLYLPTVSVSTFILLTTIHTCLNSTTSASFGEVLPRTFTRVVLVSVAELCFLSAILYFLHSPQTFNHSSQLNGVTDLGAVPQMYYPNGPNYMASPVDNSDLRIPGQRVKISLCERLFVIGYKYVVVNIFILVTAILKIRFIKITAILYVCVTSFIFSSRAIKHLCDNTKNPLLFIFPVLQPIFIYILLPR